MNKTFQPSQAEKPDAGPAGEPSVPGLVAPAGGRARHPSRVFAALDLGTNNCRLLIATATGRGFRIIDSYSRIVRLGEGLTAAGVLSEAAMERALAALAICAGRIRKQSVWRIKAVATQACRIAANGPDFITEVERRTGLRLEIISPRQEAQLSVTGCLNLLDRTAKAALVLDVGGGSTELSWVDLSLADVAAPAGRPRDLATPVAAWLSVPIGVVTLAERFPEPAGGGERWFRAMVEAVKASVAPFAGADRLRAIFAAGQAHLVGTSGAITSLAGLHLDLPRYNRERVDGLWMTRQECQAAAFRLARLTPAQRAVQPCIGPDRADLVLAGAAILEAVQELWPCERVRVADRGLREGLLLGLIAGHRGATRRHRSRRGKSPQSVSP